MGYTPEDTIFRLRFDEFPGLEINVYDADLRVVFELSDVNMSLSKDNTDNLVRMLDVLINHIESWNLQHPRVHASSATDASVCICGLRKDDPIPVRAGVLKCFPMGFSMKLILSWVTAMTTGALPKELSGWNGDAHIPEEVIRTLAGKLSPGISPMQNSS